MKNLLSTIALLFTFAAQAIIIPQTSTPTTNVVPWLGLAGVPGGIPARNNISVTLTAGAALSAIQSAINNAQSNQVVQLSAGGYNVGGSIQMKDGVTLRGAGLDKTWLTNCQILLNNPNYTYPYKAPTTANWTAGYTQYTSNLTVSSTSGLSVGNILVLDQANYTNNLGVATFGVNSCSTCDFSVTGGRTLMQYALVTGIAGNVVTISPGLYSFLWTNTTSPQVHWWPYVWTVKMAGIEDLSISGTPSTQIVDMDCCYACWIKNCHLTQGGPFIVRMWGTKNSEVRHSKLDTLVGGNASGNYGFELRWSSDGLIEDNIIMTVPNDKWEGTSGFVFAYNYGTNFVYDTPTTWLGETTMHHGGFPNYNLWEGNHFGNWLADNIKGAGGFATVARNRLAGFYPGKTGGTYPIRIMGDNWYCNIVGNVLGTYGYHSVYADGNQGGEIYAETDGFFPGQLSHWVIHANYDVVTSTNGGVVWQNGISDHTVPNSYFLSSSPSYFGFLTWPPFDPSRTNAAGIDPTNIPAGYRYVYGVDPPANSGGTAPSITTQPQNQNLQVGQTISLSVVASGSQPLSYQWKKAGVAIAGATTTLYQKGNAQTTDSGSYAVTVTNTLGTVTSSSATVTVTNPAVPLIGITLNQLNFGIVPTNTVNSLSFNVVNTGTGTLTGNASVSSPFSIASGGSYSLGAGASQTVTVRYTPTVNATDSGSITLTGGGGTNVAVAGIAYNILPLNAINLAAATVQSPFTNYSGVVMQNIDSTGQGVAFGGDVYIGFQLVASSASVHLDALVEATNSANSSFWIAIDAFGADPQNIWQVTNLTTSGLSSRPVSWVGAGTTNLPQFNTNVWSLGVGPHYIHVAGRSPFTRLSTLTVSTNFNYPTAPIITIQPTSQTVVMGQATDFFISAFGTAPLTYQWYYNNNAIPGANLTNYFLPICLPQNAGPYFCVVTNAAGSVQSFPALLNVLIPIGSLPSNTVMVIKGQGE